MEIAYVTLQGRGLIDDCLSEAVALMQGFGLRLSGTVRSLPVNHHAHPCDMDIRVLPDGQLHRISQALGPGSSGCRLDAGRLEVLSVEVEARIPGSDLLVVNKFGKQECLGRGMCTAIVRALDLGIPVLVGVNGLNLPDFARFVAGDATRIAADPRAILRWALGRSPVGETWLAAGRASGAPAWPSAVPSGASGRRRRSSAWW